MVILIDNGHGANTKGKCSPDGTIREYAWAREIARMLEAELVSLGYDARRITPEDYDVSLTIRCRRVNAICKKVGARKCLLVSIHINAAKSDKKWHDASGWTGWVAPKSSESSKRLAQLLYSEADKFGLKGNRSVPSCRYWVGNFAIVRDTNCPAVLTENMFQDNKSDVAFLKSEEGKRTIVQLHVNGIVNYISSLYPITK